MHRWNWIVARAYGPAGFMLLAAIASDVILSPLQASPLLAGFVSITDWIRLGQQLQNLIDADLRPPSARQIAYALNIAKVLDIPLPGEALRHRGSMFDFLDRYVPLFKEHLRLDDTQGSP